MIHNKKKRKKARVCVCGVLCVIICSLTRVCHWQRITVRSYNQPSTLVLSLSLSCFFLVDSSSFCCCCVVLLSPWACSPPPPLLPLPFTHLFDWICCIAVIVVGVPTYSTRVPLHTHTHARRQPKGRATRLLSSLLLSSVALVCMLHFFLGESLPPLLFHSFFFFIL